MGLRLRSDIVGIVYSLFCESAIEGDVVFVFHARGALVHASYPVRHVMQNYSSILEPMPSKLAAVRTCGEMLATR